MNAVPENQHPTVVVGFDGRWQEFEILRRAAREAERRGWPLLAVTVLHRAGDLDHEVRNAGDSIASVAVAREHLSFAAGRLRQEFPTITVRAFTADALYVSPDWYPMDRAGLLIIGSRGVAGEGAAQPGSISRLLVAAARCPVLFLPAQLGPQESRPADAHRSVLAAIGDDLLDADVLQIAVGEALSRRCGLRVLHCHPAPEDDGVLASRPEPGREPGPTGCSLLDHIIATVSGTPELDVVPLHEPPGPAVVRLSTDAPLVVVGGSADHLAGTALPSNRYGVTGHLLEHANCEVLIVPRARRRPTDRDVTALSLSK